MLAFHEFLKNCRLEKGLSIEQVSHALDIHRELLYQYEANKTFPNGKNLIKLARFYHFSLDALFNIIPNANDKVPIYNAIGEPIYHKNLVPKENTAYYVLGQHLAVLVEYTNHYIVGKETLAFYKHKATIFKILKEENEFFLLSNEGELFRFNSQDIEIIGIILQWITF